MHRDLCHKLLTLDGRYQSMYYNCTPPPVGGGKGKMMDEKTKKNISNRLASASGHIKGIERMVAEDVYCIDVIKQIQAVQAALSKVSAMILENHLRTCVTTAIKGDSAEEREQVLQEVVSVFTVTDKI
jgi:DNA-binding FrmR family transcriptional regulator